MVSLGVGLQQASAFAILMLLSLFLIVIHLGFASATALASTMIPIVISVLTAVQTPGINVVGMTMLLQFVVSFGFILPVNAPQNMIAYGDRAAGDLRAHLLVMDGVHEQAALTSLPWTCGRAAPTSCTAWLAGVGHRRPIASSAACSQPLRVQSTPAGFWRCSVTDIGIELGRLINWNRDETANSVHMVRANRDKLSTHFTILALFFGGGVAGALAFKAIGFAATIPIACALAALALPPILIDLHIRRFGRRPTQGR